MKRIYDQVIEEHLKNYSHMIFLVGPRQVGKTTLSKNCQNFSKNYNYLNWDYDEDQLLILKGVEELTKKYHLLTLGKEKNIIALYEIHKYRNWRNYLKGFYDKYNEFINFVITGSAKLDVFRSRGDSLMGRYLPYRIHPLSIGECINPVISSHEIRTPKKISSDLAHALLKFGGFPEALTHGSERFHRRWGNLRSQQLFMEDIRDITRIQEIAQLKLLALFLKEQTGQLVNYSSLAKKIKVTINTVQSWLNTLNAFYYCFQIKPWSRNVTRPLMKQPKIYLYDWSQVKDEGARYENFIACHLNKSVDYWNDLGFGDYDLFFIRDKEKREVDFLITKNQEPWFLVEVKSSRKMGLHKQLFTFQEQLKTKHAFQIVFDMEYEEKDCFSYTQPVIVPYTTFLSQLM